MTGVRTGIETDPFTSIQKTDRSVGILKSFLFYMTLEEADDKDLEETEAQELVT